MSEVGTHTIKVSIKDTKAAIVKSSFTLTVTNQAPCVISLAPAEIIAIFNVDYTFTLPDSIDPEGLPYTTII